MEKKIKNIIQKIVKPTLLSIFSITAIFTAISQPVNAGYLNIHNEPLATSDGLSVKPNLLFILDNSGSMAWHYSGDYVQSEEMCPNEKNGTSLSLCTHGDPLFSNSQVNMQYYDPKIRYYPPNDYQGNAWPQGDPWSAVLKPFLTSGSSVRRIDIANYYQDVFWCKNSSSNVTYQNIQGNNPECVKLKHGETEKYPDNTYKYKKTNAYWCRYASDTPPSSNCKMANYYESGSRFDNDNYNWGHNSTYSYYKTTVTAPPYYYQEQAPVQWCQYSNANGYYNCDTKRTSTRKIPKLQKATPEIIGVGATGSLTFQNYYNNSNSTRTASISSVTVDGVNLLSSSINVNVNRYSYYYGTAQASDVAAQINAKTSITGYSADVSGSRVIIYAPFSSTSTTNTNYNGLTITVSYSRISAPTRVSFSGAVDYSPAVTTGLFKKVEIKSDISSYPKLSVDRTDCTGSSCTYSQELQNFANWFVYYKNRMDMMKTAVSRVFSEVSETKPGVGFRIGFRQISSPSLDEVRISEFDEDQRKKFYDSLFGANPTSSTPLRTALTNAGRLYGNKYNYDPVTQSCQQNFTFLSTDGYWNDSSGFYQLNSNTNVGNTDGTSSGEKLPVRDNLNVSNSLADVAQYYWKNDLRPDLEDNVPNSNSNPANWQHMVTFTLGIGIDGFLTYDKNYLSGGSSDYNNLVNGVEGYNWGNPINNSAESRIDDLWHAAVNGRGIYYSAKNPNEIITSITTTLNAAAAITGSGAAAATSNLEPVAGDNHAYTASYTTKDWTGDLKAQEIDLTTGEIDGGDVLWSAAEMLDAKTKGTRKLYTINKSLSTEDKKMALTWSNVQSKGWDLYFDPNNLGQCQGELSICSGHNSENLFKYIIGTGNNPNDSYRVRKTLLGDIIHSQPVFVGKPSFGYSENNYQTFYDNNEDRKGAVYVGANDGFLHAFDAETGDELWAYAPNEIINKLYKLADNSYYGNHDYFVDGKITVGDIYDGTKWRTILVSGLNAGGKSYFAIDVTDPENPKVLWEFTHSTLGLSYGNPIITKLSDGNWYVLLSSGYNNNAKGQLYVVNPVAGTLKYKVEIAGSSNNNGFAKMVNLSYNSLQDNTSEHVYGGDLDGNVWKFTLSGSSGSVYKFATIGEPITTKPVLAAVNGSGSATIPAVIIGTGKFLELTDRSDQSIGSLYALKDEGSTTHNTAIASSSDYVKQVISTSGSSNRKITDYTVDWAAKKGWWVRFVDPGERVSIDPKLQLGTLVVSTNIPTSEENSCTAGGYAWLNYFNVKTGSSVENSSTNPQDYLSTRLGNALVVGINIIKLPNGKLVSIVTTSDNQHPVSTTPTGTGNLGKKRISWRELITNN